MKQFLFVLLSIYAMLIVSGCSSVTTKHPLSNNLAAIDREKFEGIWLVDDDEALHVKFSGNGIARIAGFDWESDQFNMVHGEMIVTEGDEHNFLTVRFQKDGKWMDDYYFLAFKFTEKGDLVLWLPNVDAFEEAIGKKKLAGTINEDQYSTNITVTDVSEKLFEYISGPDNFNLFDYKEPIVIYRITK